MSDAFWVINAASWTLSWTAVTTVDCSSCYQVKGCNKFSSNTKAQLCLVVKNRPPPKKTSHLYVRIFDWDSWINKTSAFHFYFWHALVSGFWFWRLNALVSLCTSVRLLAQPWVLLTLIMGVSDRLIYVWLCVWGIGKKGLVSAACREGGRD